MAIFPLAGGFFGLIYLPSIVSVGYYFTSKRALATGIAVCGSGMGAFSFAPMVSWLLETYNWKPSLRILAGKPSNAPKRCVRKSARRCP